jgi:hypothetical protein
MTIPFFDKDRAESGELRPQSIRQDKQRLKFNRGKRKIVDSLCDIGRPTI